MRSLIYVLSILATASAVVAAPQALNAAKKKGATPKAIYFMTNDAAENSIVALKVGQDGTLSDGSRTMTGGKGASGVDGNSSMPAGPDALFSQSALKVEGNWMVAVNPGSNTMTLMSIDTKDPTKLTMVGQPVNTMGEFPVTAAISRKNKIACVGNSGARAGVACFDIHFRKGLIPLAKSQIVFPINQTTPPVGPTNTVSHVFFNQDESMLLTTVKGDPMKNNTGFLSMLPVQKGSVGTQDTRSSPPGTAVLFGSTPIPGSKDIFATDASFGAATISTEGTPAVIHNVKIEGQKATCWAAMSAMTKTAFVTDTAQDNLVEVDPRSGEILQNTQLMRGNPGYVDLVVGGKFVYALSPGSKDGMRKAYVAVVDVSSRPAKPVQNFQPEGPGRSSMGMTASM
ncbi:MAG: hypothetical protein L6R42_002634 [Xanthoria sp. 1 TBL-2021]|nr:MAG: hypothetical protein L6R42_002634 [Xanthoria sp. 1 TBL-2021]